MKNLQEWWSISELLEKKISDLPATDKGISKKANREQWVKRQRSGVKGKTFEYHYSSLPIKAQNALGFVTLDKTSYAIADYIVKTPTGGQLFIDLKAKGMKFGELEQTLIMVEEALNIACQKLTKQDDSVKLNNHERRLLLYYQNSSIEGKQAIMNMAETMSEMNGKKENSNPSEAYKVA